MSRENRPADLDLIESALRAGAELVRGYAPGEVAWTDKEESDRWDPVTEADEALDVLLREFLLRPGEGWLSEETVDDPSRPECDRVWIVDPLDGTREFVQGIPEWCISVGLAERGKPVAGGILNPATGELFLGAPGWGITVDGHPPRRQRETRLAGATVLASRSEVGRGEWQRFDGAPFEIHPCGSVAYKLALVAAGSYDASWTLVPKNEWDIAAGCALLRAGQAEAFHADGTRPSFNRADPRLPNLLAGDASLLDEFLTNWL